MTPREILWLLLVACLFTSISPATIAKRAVPNTSLYTSVKNKTVGPHDGQKMDIKPESQCLAGHLEQKHGNKSVCCRPTVCAEGFEIKTCSISGGKDKCVACQKGHLQLNNISSFNMEEASCFPDPYYNTYYYCPIDDTKTSNHLPSNCAMYCECKTESCYVGNPCGCTRVAPCGKNQQLNKHTEKCEPCPQFSYKRVEGCGRCVYNLTQFSQGLTFPPVQQTTSIPDNHNFTSEESTTTATLITSNIIITGAEEQKYSLKDIGIIVGVVVAVLLISVCLTLVFRCCFKSHFFRNMSNKMCPDQSMTSSSTRDVETTAETTIAIDEDVPQTQPLLSKGTVPQEITPTETLSKNHDSGFSEGNFVNLGEKESNIVERGKVSSPNQPTENQVLVTQAFEEDTNDIAPVSLYSNSPTETSELPVASLDVNSFDTSVKMDTESDESGPVSNEVLSDSRNGEHFMETLKAHNDPDDQETLEETFTSETSMSGMAMNLQGSDSVEKELQTSDCCGNVEESTHGINHVVSCDNSDDVENINHEMKPFEICHEGVDIEKITHGTSSVVTCDRSVGIQLSLPTQPEGKPYDKSFAQRPLQKEETPKVKPMARVYPFARVPDDVRSESSGASTMTSYPSIAHPSINSVSSVESSYQFSENSHEVQGHGEQYFYDSQGHQVSRRDPVGQSLGERSFDETSLKQPIPSEHTQPKWVDGNDSDVPDVINNIPKEKKLFKESTECDKLGGTLPYDSRNVKLNMLGVKVSNEVGNKQDNIAGVYSFNANLPSNDSSIEITMHDDLKSRNDSVQMTEFKAAEQTWPNAQTVSQNSHMCTAREPVMDLSGELEVNVLNEREAGDGAYSVELDLCTINSVDEGDSVELEDNEAINVEEQNNLEGNMKDAKSIEDAKS